MKDIVFGELRKEDDYGWWGKQTLDFGENTCTIELLIHQGEEDEIPNGIKRHLPVFLRNCQNYRKN